MAEPMIEDKPKKTVGVADIMGGAEKPKADKPKGESKPKASKSKKHKHTHIEHHDDGSHTVRHSGAGDEVSYAAPDMDAVHDGLEQHIGDPNADEGQAQQPMAQAEPQPEPQPMAQPQGA